jgi:hypothetical protein
MEQPCALLAQPVTLGAEVWTVTDDTGTGRSVTFPAGVYRVLLGSTTTRTSGAPGDLLAHIEAALGASWTVRMTTSGRVRVTYLGPMVTVGVLTPPMGGSTMMRVLGSPTLPATWNVGDTATASYLPTHGIFAAAVDPDTGWQAMPGRFAGARLSTGAVYGWGDRLARRERSLTFRLLPKDAAQYTALVGAGAAPGTPALGPTARALNPWASEPAQAPPWGAIETIATAGAQSLGFSDDLQRVIAGTSSTFDVAYLTPDALRDAKAVVSVERFDPRRDLAGVVLSWSAEVSR